MGKYLCLAIGKDQCQFVREPLAVVQDFGAVFFLFFPMIGELHRPPMGDVAVFTLAEYSIEHSCGAQIAPHVRHAVV